MRMTLPSRLIGTATAFALALTTLTAAPVQAQEDYRAGRAIATILGLAIVGSIIHENRKSDAPATPRVERRTPTYQPAPAPVHPRPLPRRVDHKLLPQQCLRSFDTRQGQVRMFPRRCLERTYRAVNRLPQTCEVRVRTTQGQRAGFGARCLRDYGYRLARG